MTAKTTTPETIERDLMTFLRTRRDLIERLGGPNIKWAAKGPDAFFLRFGRFLKGGTVPDAFGEGQPKECFNNAFMALCALPTDWTYCEGYAVDLSLAIPIHHAWLFNTKSGAIMEVTPSWVSKDRVIYFGVPFKRDFVLDSALEYGWPSPLFDGDIFNMRMWDAPVDSWLAHHEHHEDAAASG